MSTSNLCDATSRNRPDEPPQIPPKLKLVAIPSRIRINLLFIPPISITVASPLCCRESKAAPFAITLTSSKLSAAFTCLPTSSRPWPVTPIASTSVLEIPAPFNADSITSSALSTGSVVGIQPSPTISLSFITTAFVVEEPESTPIVIPSCFSRIKSDFRAINVFSASSLEYISISFGFSTFEYTIIGISILSCRNLLIVSFTIVPSAHLKQVRSKAPFIVGSSNMDTALAIIIFRLGLSTSNPNSLQASSTSDNSISG